MEQNQEPERSTSSTRINTPNWVFIILAIIAVILIIYGVSYEPGLREYDKGLKYQETNQLTLAEQQYKIAIQKNPDLAEAYLNLGVIYIENGWYNGAERMIKECITILQRKNKTIVEGYTLDQILSIAYNNLGTICMGRALQAEININISLARDQWKSGMEYYRKAIELDPMNSQAQANIELYKNAY